MITVLILLGYALVVLVDTFPIYKDGTRKEFWVSASILAFSLVVAVLFSFGIQLPGPAKPIEHIVTKIFGL